MGRSCLYQIAGSLKHPIRIASSDRILQLRNAVARILVTKPRTINPCSSRLSRPVFSISPPRNQCYRFPAITKRSSKLRKLWIDQHRSCRRQHQMLVPPPLSPYRGVGQNHRRLPSTDPNTPARHPKDPLGELHSHPIGGPLCLDLRSSLGLIPKLSRMHHGRLHRRLIVGQNKRLRHSLRNTLIRRIGRSDLKQFGDHIRKFAKGESLQYLRSKLRIRGRLQNRRARSDHLQGIPKHVGNHQRDQMTRLAPTRQSPTFDLTQRSTHRIELLDPSTSAR